MSSKGVLPGGLSPEKILSGAHTVSVMMMKMKMIMMMMTMGMAMTMMMTLI